MKERLDAPTSASRGWIGRSWIGRHWRGELSLGVSYWLMGFLGKLAAIVAVAALSVAIADYEPNTGLVAIVAMWTVAFLVWVWQVVGIWRSANNHPGRGGRLLWARIAKVMMVLATLQMVGTLAKNTIPQVQEAYRIANGDDEVGDYELRLLNGGTEIEYFGGIPFGATADLKKILDAAPQVKVVHLNSHGGRTTEARKMAALIRERELVTYTTDHCHSACTNAFLGGRQRFVHASAKVGFHMAASAGANADALRAQNESLKQEAIAAGVNPDFAERAWSTAHSDLWVPSAEELVRAGFATAVATGQFAMSGFGSQPQRDDLVAKVKEVPMYDAISEAAPTEFAEIMGIFADGIANGRIESEVLGNMRGKVGEVVTARMPLASDEAIVESIGVMVQQLQILAAAKDAGACTAFLRMGQSKTNTDPRQYFDAELQARELRATEQVIRTADPRRPQIPAKEGKMLIEALMKRIEATHPKATLRLLGQLNSLAGPELCTAMRVLYMEALALPPPRNARLSRYLMGR